MLNRPPVCSDGQSGYLMAFRSSKLNHRVLSLDSYFKPVVSAIKPRTMEVLKRSFSLDLMTDSRASHNSLDSGYTSDTYLNSPDTSSSDAGTSDHGLVVTLSNSSSKSDDVFFHTLLGQCGDVIKPKETLSNDTSPTVSDITTLTDTSSTEPSTTNSTPAPSDNVSDPIARNTVVTDKMCFPSPSPVDKENETCFEIKECSIDSINTTSSQTCPIGSPKLNPNAKPRPSRVSTQTSKNISKLATKFECCSSQDKLEFVSYYVALDEQRILKRFIEETFKSKEDEVTVTTTPEKIVVTIAGEVKVFSIQRKKEIPSFSERSLSFDSLECEPEPETSTLQLGLFATPNYAKSVSKLIFTIQKPTYNLGLRPYKRKHIEPDPCCSKNLLEFNEISPVVLDYPKNHPKNKVHRESQLERPASLMLTLPSSFESANIKEFLIQDTGTTPERLERTLHLSEWGRWRRKSIDLPDVSNQRRSNIVSSKYTGREIPSSAHHEKRPCKLFTSNTEEAHDELFTSNTEEAEDELFTSNTEEADDEAIPLLEVAPLSQSVSPVSKFVSPVKQSSMKKKKKRVDLTFVGFNALSYLKHMVNKLSFCAWLGLLAL